MSNLHRNLAPITEAAWDQIEDEARRTFTRNVAGRRVVDVAGPEGPALSAVGTGHLRSLGPAGDGVDLRLREVQAVVELRVPFSVTRAAVDDVERGAEDSDWQPVKDAAQRMAFAEDRAIVDGLAAAGIAGIRPSGSNAQVPLPADMREAPDAVARALSTLRTVGVDGPYALLLSADGYTALSEITDQGNRVLHHVEKLLGDDETPGQVLWAPAIQGGLLVTLRGGDYRLTLGQDLAIGYQSHDDDRIELYLQESFTFQAFTSEASVAFGG